MESFWSRLDHHVKVRLPIVLGVILISVVATALVTEPSRRTTGYAPPQPINFSHKLHAGDMKIDCRYCHGGAETNRHAGIPALKTCMNCHGLAAVDKPGVALLRSLYDRGLPVAWRRVHRLPDFVYFSHNIHIGAGIGCENCHGDVAKMDVIQQVRPLSMGNCLDCHRDVRSQVVGTRPDLAGPENCSACHR